ncbi:MAG TPA: hypothetical protein VFB04_11870, partial [Terriglobales bacterium]|nr:hypothetical protein [Terriglobales bacterium]
PNQFVNIHLLLETRRNVTVVPSAAIQRGPQGDYVYVVKPDKTVEVRPVSVAITEGNVAQIASGVSPREDVVTDGQDKLQAGSHVEPHLASPAGGQNASSPAAAGPGARTYQPGTRQSGTRTPNSGTASQ